MNRRRLFYYILLNILVSAAVAGALLFFYDRSHRAVPATLPPLPTSVAATAGDLKIGIASVIGAGRLESEIVVLQNNGSGPLVLTGWSLKDGKGNVYTFPQLTLFPGASLQVHSAAGTDTAADLYWDRSGPLWSSGRLVTLYDASGIARAFYTIP